MPKALKLLPLFLIILSSCTLYKEFPITIYAPAERIFPADINNILIFSSNFKFNKDTLYQYHKDNSGLKKHSDATIDGIDRLMVNTSLLGFVEAINKENRFQKIQILPYDFITPHKGDSILIFKSSLIEKLARTYEVDAVAVLEFLSYFQADYLKTKKEMITVAFWRIYNPNEMNLIDRKIITDTIFWDHSNFDRKSEKLPSMHAAYKIAAEVAGKNYADRFNSKWLEVNRMYIVSPLEDFRQAAQYFTDGKWDEAIELWNKYSDKKYGKLAIHANYDIALAHEMKDDIDEAIQYIDKSLEQAISKQSKNDFKLVLEYKKILINRKIDLDKISKREPVQEELLPIEF